MKPIPVLGIPQYNRPDLLARCIASIDHPVEKLVIVDQGPELQFPDVVQGLKGQMGPMGPLRNVVLIRHPNAGVAGAWNEIIKLFPAPWWMIANNDIQFAPGDLAKMAEMVNGDKGIGDKGMDSLKLPSVQPGIFYGNHGASWFGITAPGVAMAGLFDENIFPAYLEDCDWSYRADLLGVRRENVPDCRAVHGDDRNSGSCTIQSDPELREKNHRTHGSNFDYYIQKWGGTNEREKFKTPFNDPHWPVWAWKFDPAFRAAQQWQP